jgi:hypothetical protein
MPRREPVRALDHHEPVAAAAALSGYEHVYGPARPGRPLQPVQLESIEAGDQRAWPGMQQPASTAVVASGWPVPQQHETGRQPAPRAARAAPVRDGVAVQPELHQVAHEDDETAPVGDEVVEVGDIGAAARHASTVRPRSGPSQGSLGSVDAQGTRWKTPVPTNGALVG